MKIDEEFIKRVVIEINMAHGQAMAIFTTALCQQLDPARLTEDLKTSIAAAKQSPVTTALAIQWATQAQAAAEAQRILQARPASEGPHPNRPG